MDNITHSLVGYVTSKCVTSTQSSSLSAKFQIKNNKFFLLTSSIIAANFPDLDLIYSLFDSSQLGYLLHHRGHTHTFIYLIPQILILVSFLSLIFKIKDKQVLFFGVLLTSINMIFHILLDGLNIYGVHPFYPWDNTWYYGDRLFIIEPLLWFTLIPLALTPLKKKFGFRFFVILLNVAALYFAIKFSLMSVATSLILSTYFVGLVLLYDRMFERTKVVTSISLVLVFILAFLVQGERVERKLKQAFTSVRVENEKLVEIAVSPLPGNPICWNFWTVRTLDNIYYVNTGRVKVNRLWGFSCPPLKDKQEAVMNLKLPENNSILWGSHFSTDTESLFAKKSDCRLEQWFQFARIPFVIDSHLYEDLRFSIRKGRNFTSLDLNDKNIKCAKYPAPWINPRN